MRFAIRFNLYIVTENAFAVNFLHFNTHFSLCQHNSSTNIALFPYFFDFFSAFEGFFQKISSGRLIFRTQRVIIKSEASIPLPRAFLGKKFNFAESLSPPRRKRRCARREAPFGETGFMYRITFRYYTTVYVWFVSDSRNFGSFSSLRCISSARNFQSRFPHFGSSALTVNFPS